MTHDGFIALLFLIIAVIGAYLDIQHRFGDDE